MRGWRRSTCCAEKQAVVSGQATQAMQTQVALQTQVAYASSDQVVNEWARTEGHYAQSGDQPVVPVEVAGRCAGRAGIPHARSNANAQLAGLVGSVLRRLDRRARRASASAHAAGPASMLQKPERLPLFPDTTTIQNDSLRIAGQELTRSGGALRHAALHL